MKSFLTGSHVYGTPNEHSDIDLVVRMDSDTVDRLAELTSQDIAEQIHYSDGSISLRFGKLNLIVCLTDEIYAAWKVATWTAEREKDKKKIGESLDKNVSAKLFQELFKKAGLA